MAVDNPLNKAVISSGVALGGGVPLGSQNVNVEETFEASGVEDTASIHLQISTGICQSSTVARLLVR